MVMLFTFFVALNYKDFPFLCQERHFKNRGCVSRIETETRRP